MIFFQELRRLGVSTLLLSLLLMQGCAQNVVYHKYEYDRAAQERMGDKKVVALAPPGLLAQEHPHAFLYPVIEREITVYLERAGYKVLPQQDFIDAWEASVAKVGGIYNSKTGQFDESQANRSFQLTFDALRKRHDAAAFVLPVIAYENLPLKNFYEAGSWDGVVRRVPIEGGGFGRWKSMPVMSLTARIFNTDGTLLLSSQGGIDFIGKTKSGFTETALVNREPDEFSVEYIQEAIQVAFHPFIAVNRLKQH
jgi:hypothetical protein